MDKYYELTKNAKPHKNVKDFLSLDITPKKAIDLGCGAGRDTIALLKQNWEVLAIDKEDTESIIKEQLTKEEQERFTFTKSFFGEMNLPESNLIVANFSLPFAKKEKFDLIWNRIRNSLLKGGYFVGNFLGKKDSWAKQNKKLIFLSENDVKLLFEGFELIQFNESERDQKTALGEEKHWHIYDIIARKK